MADRTTDVSELAEPRPLRAMLDEKTSDPELRRLGQAFQRLAQEPLPTAPAAGWATLEEHALALAQRRQWRFHLGELWRGAGPVKLGLCVAAVALLAVFGVLGARTLGPAVFAHGPGVAGPRLPSAPRGSTADARAYLTLEADALTAETTLRCGARLQATAGRADITQEDAYHPRIHLRRGRIAVQVPPLPSGGSLVVQSSDAEVIVHGTRFVVDRHEQEDLTVVAVEEGLVEVRPIGGHRSAVFVRAGEQVRIPSGASYVRQLDAQVRAYIEAGRCDDPVTAAISAYLQNAAPGAEVSAALYLKGSCAAARGERTGALEAFEQVAATAGSSLRADNALARCAELRAKESVDDGTTAWQRYLQRFPQGQHRESAQRYLRDHVPQLGRP